MAVAAVGAGQETGRPGVFRVLSAVSAVTTVGVFPVFLVGGLGVQLQDDLDFGAAVLGLATAAFFGVAALASRGMGWFVERVGARFGMRIAACTSSLCLFAIASVDNVTWLLAVLLIAGLATALAQPSSNLLITQCVPVHRRGMGFGVKQSAIPAAIMLAGAAVPTVALTIGWRWAFIFAAVIGIGAAFLVPRFSDSGRLMGSPPKGSFRGAGRKALLLIAAAGGLGSAAANALGSFLTITAVDIGFSPWIAGLILSVASGTGLAIRLIGGVLADRKNPNLLLVVSVMLLAGAVGFGLISMPSQPLFLLGVAIGFGAGWAWPGLLNFAIAKIAPDRVASATSITQTGIYLGASSGPLLFGFLAEQAGLQAAWSAVAVVAVVAGLLLLLVRPPNRTASAQ